MVSADEKWGKLVQFASALAEQKVSLGPDYDAYVSAYLSSTIIL